MDITVKLKSVRIGKNHITLGVTVNGVLSRDIVLRRSDFTIEPDEYEEALTILIRSYIKELGLTSLVDTRNAIESKVFKL